MKPIIYPLAVLFILTSAFTTRAQIITTYAGNGITGYSGDNEQATDASLNGPFGLAVDGAGNLYIAEKNNNVIRKVTPGGIISTYAGTGVAGYSGDGGAATNAKLNTPYDLTVDHSGNLYFTDFGNDVLRKIDTLGTITTLHLIIYIVCPPIGGSSGVTRTIAMPRGIAVDNPGNIYFTCGDDMVCKRNLNDSVSLFAGNCNLSTGGDGGPATHAGLKNPIGLSVDALGNVYIGDDGNNLVRKVNTANIITTFAGTGAYGSYHGDGGMATAAGINGPIGATADNFGNVYIQDFFNRRIRRVNSSGIITTAAGDGSAGYSGDGGPATDASFYDATGFAIDRDGNYYIADAYYNVIRKVTMPPTLGTKSIPGNSAPLLYPNPTKGALFVMCQTGAPADEKATLEIYDVIGQPVYETYMTAQNGIVNAEVTLPGNIPNGVYMLHILSNNEHIVSRFVLAR